jgi:hypothetical protein
MNTRWQNVILALLSERTITAAAARAGVAARTVHRLCKNPDFRRAYDQARERFFAESVAELARLEAARPDRVRQGGSPAQARGAVPAAPRASFHHPGAP